MKHAHRKVNHLKSLDRCNWKLAHQNQFWPLVHSTSICQGKTSAFSLEYRLKSCHTSIWVLTYGYIYNTTLLFYIQFVFEWEANIVPTGWGLCGRTYVVHIAPVPHDSVLCAVTAIKMNWIQNCIDGLPFPIKTDEIYLTISWCILPFLSVKEFSRLLWILADVKYYKTSPALDLTDTTTTW